MQPVIVLLSLGFVVALGGCAATQASSSCPGPSELEVPMSTDAQQVAILASQIAWARCPPSLPTPCEMAVLEGDPKREMLFTVRFRTGEGFEMKPHWHPRNERVTILEGKIGVGFGDVIDRGDVEWFGPGDYYVNAKDAHHFVLADGPAVLQITGIGPWQANFLETK